MKCNHCTGLWNLAQNRPLSHLLSGHKEYRKKIYINCKQEKKKHVYLVTEEMTVFLRLFIERLNCL